MATRALLCECVRTFNVHTGMTTLIIKQLYCSQIPELSLMGRPECANSARWWLSYLRDMHNNNHKHTTKRKCHAFFHVYLCISFSIKENENKKNKKKIKIRQHSYLLRNNKEVQTELPQKQPQISNALGNLQMQGSLSIAPLPVPCQKFKCKRVLLQLLGTPAYGREQ